MRKENSKKMAARKPSANINQEAKRRQSQKERGTKTESFSRTNLSHLDFQALGDRTPKKSRLHPGTPHPGDFWWSGGTRRCRKKKKNRWVGIRNMHGWGHLRGVGKWGGSKPSPPHHYSQEVMIEERAAGELSDVVPQGRKTWRGVFYVCVEKKKNADQGSTPAPPQSPTQSWDAIRKKRGVPGRHRPNEPKRRLRRTGPP